MWWRLALPDMLLRAWLSALCSPPAPRSVSLSDVLLPACLPAWPVYPPPPPPTPQVWADVYSLPVPGCDGKTAAEIFEAAGCITPAAPSCAACLGGPRDTFARMNEPEVCVSTTNRNFPGRMGHKEGQIYLASPYTAAASALKGKVCDPREYM